MYKYGITGDSIKRNRALRVDMRMHLNEKTTELSKYIIDFIGKMIESYASIDAWCLGSAVYEIICGSPPFYRTSPIASLVCLIDELKKLRFTVAPTRTRGLQIPSDLFEFMYLTLNLRKPHLREWALERMCGKQALPSRGETLPLVASQMHALSRLKEHT